MAIVTISHEIGAGGPEIGQLEEKLSHLDESKPSLFERFDAETRRYITVIQTALYDFSEQDNVVLMGRGGQWLLRGIPHVLRIRVMAPFDVRVKRLTKKLAGPMGEQTNPRTVTELVRRDDARSFPEDVLDVLGNLLPADALGREVFIEATEIERIDGVGVAQLNEGVRTVRRVDDDVGIHHHRGRLVGTGKSNRDAVGARAIATIGNQTLAQQVSGGQSYLSAPEKTLTFGLGGTQLSSHVGASHPARWLSLRWTANPVQLGSRTSTVQIRSASSLST